MENSVQFLLTRQNEDWCWCWEENYGDSGVDVEAFDRFCNLPKPIVHHIMSFLPTTDSTRVSILSKRLGSVYRSDPIVDFDQPFYDQVLSRTSRKKLKRPVSFVNFMQKSFLHLKPNINIEKFKLRINDNNGISNKRNEGSNCFSIDHNNVRVGS